MESIAKYFESSKKWDLSDDSKTSEEPKKLKEITSTSSMTEEYDLFSDTLDNEDCRCILSNCLKNLKKEDYKKFSWPEQTGGYYRWTVTRWSFIVIQIYYR